MYRQISIFLMQLLPIFESHLYFLINIVIHIHSNVWQACNICKLWKEYSLDAFSNLVIQKSRRIDARFKKSGDKFLLLDFSWQYRRAGELMLIPQENFCLEPRVIRKMRDILKRTGKRMVLITYIQTLQGWTVR